MLIYPAAKTDQHIFHRDIEIVSDVGQVYRYPVGRVLICVKKVIFVSFVITFVLKSMHCFS